MWCTSSYLFFRFHFFPWEKENEFFVASLMFSLLHSRYNSLFLQRDYIITDKYRFFQPYLSEPQCWSAPSDLPNLPRGVLILNILNFVLGGNLFQIQGPFLHLYVSSPKSIWKRANRPLKLMAIPCQWLVLPTQQKKKKKSILSNFKFLYLKQIGTCYLFTGDIKSLTPLTHDCGLPFFLYSRSTKHFKW